MLRLCGVLSYGVRKRKKKKRMEEGKRTPVEENSLSASNQSVPARVPSPARTSLSFVKVGEKPAGIRAPKYERRNGVGGWRNDEGVTVVSVGREEKPTIDDDPPREIRARDWPAARPLSDLLSRSGRTRRNIDSHVGGVDYDPPYPPTSSSIARLWINGWDDRFILIRINANLSTDACMNVCITINYNTGRDTNPCTVSFRRNSRSSEIILFKRMYDGYSSFEGGGGRGKRGGDWKSVYEFVYASRMSKSIVHNAGKIIL